jgi:hypothetical protein
MTKKQIDATALRITREYIDRKMKGDIKLGIEAVRQYKINITAESKNQIKEANTHKWKGKDCKEFKKL